MKKPELKIVVSNTLEAPAVEPVPEQVEMPFAIVNGEPVTQMPKDLYIPPQAMEVFLEAFEGPLDLLLYLIRRQNLNILDIPLAEITRQYMQYIEVMSELQLELAGEYMVMAATLAEIKSRMLLPRPKMDSEGNEEDPRAELVRRLQEYERFKRAAESIDALPRLERDVWTTSAELKDRKVVRLLPTVTLQEMLIAFKDVVVRSEMFAHHHIQRERLSVRERMGDILTNLEHASFVEFVRLFRLEEGRMGVTVTFMALLELVREGLIEIVQAEPFAPIHVRAAGASRKLHVVGGSDALGVGAEGVWVADGAPAGAAPLAADGARAGTAALAADGARAGAVALAADGARAGAVALAANGAPAGTVASAADGAAAGAPATHGSDVRGAAASLDASAAATASVPGSAVVAEAVVGDAPPVGFLAPVVDDDLARFAEPALDPNFVDDSDDDLDEGPLEGVDDVVDLVAPAVPEARDAPLAHDNPEARDAPLARDNPEARDAPLARDNPEARDAPLARDNPVAPDAPLARDNPEAPDALVASDSPVALEGSDAPDVLAGPAGALPDDGASPVGLASTDLAAADPANTGSVSAGVAHIGETAEVVAVPSTSAIVEAFAVVEPLLAPEEGTHSIGSTAAVDELAATVELTQVELAQLPAEETTVVVVDTAPLSEVVQGEPSPSTADAVVAAGVSVAGEDLASLEAIPPADALEFVPVEPAEAGANESVVIVDAPELSAAEEPPPLDIEYAVPAQEVASSELPATDKTRPTDQQPAAGAQTVVNENAVSLEPPSPGEESDD